MPAFRTATWPGVILEPRPISSPEYRLGEGGALLALPDTGKFITLPDELFLRELKDLDLTNEGQVLGFVNQYGVLGMRMTNREWGLFEQLLLPYVDYRVLQAVQHPKRRERGLPGPSDPKAYMEAMGLRYAYTVGDFVLVAEMLRNATCVWLAVSEAVSWNSVFAGWEVGLLNRPRDEAQAAEVLTYLLNWGLAPFHVEVSVFPVDDEDRGANPFKYAGSLPSTFSTICLQIAHHMTEGATYRQCKNKTCGRYFYRQRGRAEYGQYRTGGLKYCSVSCARTQSSRDSRRKAKERATESSGTGPPRKTDQ